MFRTVTNLARTCCDKTRGIITTPHVTLQAYTLNYYARPDYLLLYNLLADVMKAGRFSYSDPYDWEARPKTEESKAESKSENKGLNWSATTTEGKNDRQTMSAPAQLAERQSEIIVSCCFAVRVVLDNDDSQIVVPYALVQVYQMINESNPFPSEFFARNPLGF
ncbi:hypothetical protein Y032_0374g207 [Ancylostoma ceylanicum]|uniref:Uncharacterized protein n=1 Tax=Ancylostoma ceylanicum TaxID=53326 RepID=A0A016RTQ4_9BILA|nr:hypothetical protein Y032_0374g207 [Ancylostoma ceylanicum]